MLNALVAEDVPQVADRLVELATIPGRVHVVAKVATEDDGIEATERFRIDVALVDLQLAQGTGFGIIRRLRATKGANPVCIIVVTNHAVPALKVAAFEAGADFFLDKAKGLDGISLILCELTTEERSV